MTEAPYACRLRAELGPGAGNAVGPSSSPEGQRRAEIHAQSRKCSLTAPNLSPRLSDAKSPKRSAAQTTAEPIKVVERAGQLPQERSRRNYFRSVVCSPASPASPSAASRRFLIDTPLTAANRRTQAQPRQRSAAAATNPSRAGATRQDHRTSTQSPEIGLHPAPFEPRDLFTGAFTPIRRGLVRGLPDAKSRQGRGYEPGAFFVSTSTPRADPLRAARADGVPSDRDAIWSARMSTSHLRCLPRHALTTAENLGGAVQGQVDRRRATDMTVEEAAEFFQGPGARPLARDLFRTLHRVGTRLHPCPPAGPTETLSAAMRSLGQALPKMNSPSGATGPSHAI